MPSCSTSSVPLGRSFEIWSAVTLTWRGRGQGPLHAPLNVAEGSYTRGRNRVARYHTALGSLREALACLEVAAAMGHLPELAPALRSRFDHVLGALVRLSGAR
jgi:hypothetical protein